MEAPHCRQQSLQQRKDSCHGKQAFKIDRPEQRTKRFSSGQLQRSITTRTLAQSGCSNSKHQDIRLSQFSVSRITYYRPQREYWFTNEHENEEIWDKPILSSSWFATRWNEQLKNRRVMGYREIGMVEGSHVRIHGNYTVVGIWRWNDVLQAELNSLSIHPTRLGVGDSDLIVPSEAPNASFVEWRGERVHSVTQEGILAVFHIESSKFLRNVW